MDERTFYISYYSEVSAEVTVREYDDHCVVTATHPVETVPISDWYHFCDISCNGDPLVAKDVSVKDGLHKMANALYPGAETLMEQRNVTDPREQFFTDFFIAFTFGLYYPSYPEYPDEWKHSVGWQLMNP